MRETIQQPSNNTPEHVAIFDTTLRDGMQSPGISLDTQQSLDIAQRLRSLGVDIIEAGFPISSPGNFEAVSTIAREVDGPIIAALARANAADIESAAEAVRDSERPRIHTFVSTSDIHIEHQMQSTREDVRGLAKAAVAQAKTHVEDVQFSPMDATRADIDFTAEVIQIAIDEGATTINIPDTVGYTQPYEYEAYLRRMYEIVPDLGKVVLSVHCHNDLGLAVANTFAGVKAGARQAEVAINGLGERAGNAALEEFVMLLRVRRLIDGFDTNIDSRQIGAASRMVSRYTGYSVQKNKAVVGANAFQHESGIHQSGVLNDRSTFEIMASETVGMDTDGIALGKQSGRAAVKHVLEQEGVFKPQHLQATFVLFKESADQVGGISSEQIVEIQDEAARRQTNTYVFGRYRISSSSEGVYTAKVTITNGIEMTVEASNDINHPDIDGPISALYTAIAAATNTDYAVKEHRIESIGTGKTAIAKATVTLEIDGRSVTGQGLSVDSDQAAGWAYLDAVNQTKTSES